jgi:hypothetical protein
MNPMKPSSRSRRCAAKPQIFVLSTRLEVPFRAHATFASSEATGWAFPAHGAVAGDYRDWYRRQISACAESAISRLRPCTECRARRTTVATLAAVQNGTSGAIAICKHPRRRAVRGMQQAGSDEGRSGSGSTICRRSPYRSCTRLEKVVYARTPVADPTELHLPRLPKSSGLTLGPMHADPALIWMTQ